jgi:DNA-binding MarR family transcriptional regulator
MTGRLGLPVLLARVLGGLTTELESEDGSGSSSLAVWSNVLRCVGDGISERDLASEARISKRMAVAAVTGASRRGWVQATPGDRGRHVRLTDDGAQSVASWPGRLDDLDRRLAVTDLPGAVADLVRRLPLELPWYPASYGTADPSTVGGAFAAGDVDSGVPPHGQDWKPVLRDTDRGVDGLPMTALLSQALVAFTIDYEATPMWPLTSTTLVVRHLRPEPMPLDDAPAGHGITGQGKSLLERHGVARAVPDPDDPRRQLVRLTDRGAMIRARHDGCVADVEAAWHERYGAATVQRLRDALEAHPAAVDERYPDAVVAPLHLG